MDEKTQKFVDDASKGGSVLEAMFGGASAINRQSRTIAFPGWRGKPVDEGGLGARVTIWLLGYDEIAEAEIAANAFLREKYKFGETDFDRYWDHELRTKEIKVQTLLCALRDPETPTRPFARYARTIRQLDTDTIDALYRAFIEFLSSRSPFEHVSEKAGELEELIDALGKGQAAEIFFSRYDSISLQRIAISLAARLVKLTRANSSRSSSASDSDPSSIDSSDEPTPQ